MNESATYYGEHEAEDAMSVMARWMGRNNRVQVIYHNGTAVDADIFQGVIRIPRLACASGITQEALMLLRGRVYHEAGHIDETKLSKADYPKGALFEIWNALEDRRMESSESGKHKGCEVVFRWSNHYYNRKIAESIMKGKDAPLWEALVAMSLMVESVPVAWTLTQKAQDYFDAAYQEFIKVKQCADAKECLDLAKVIYQLLKDVNEEWKQANPPPQQGQPQQGGEPQQGEGQGESGDGQGEEGEEKGEPQQGGSKDFDDYENDKSSKSGKGSGQGDDSTEGDDQIKGGKKDGPGDGDDDDDDDGDSSKSGKGDKGDQGKDQGKDGDEGDEDGSGKGKDGKDADGTKDDKGVDGNAQGDDQNDDKGNAGDDKGNDAGKTKGKGNESGKDGEDGSGSDGDGSEDSDGDGKGSQGDGTDGAGEDKKDGSSDGDGKDGAGSKGGAKQDGNKGDAKGTEADGEPNGEVTPGDVPYKPQNKEPQGGKGDGKDKRDLEDEFDGLSREQAMNEDLEEFFRNMSAEDKRYTSRRDLDVHSAPETTEEDKTSYHERLSQVSVTVATMIRALDQALRSLSRCRKNPYLRAGRIDRNRLVAIAKGLSKEVFYRTRDGISLDVAVAITMDESGSMSNYYTVQLLAMAIGEALTSIGVPFEIIGTTTMYGGGDRRMVSMNGFSRVNPIVYKHYKLFNEQWNNVRQRMVHSGAYHHNVDGEVIEYAAFRLAQRRESRKVIFSLSDGEPCAGHGNDTEMAVNLKRVCTRVRKHGIEVYGFGVETESPRALYGKDWFVYLDKIEQMGPEFTREFVKIVTEGRVKV